MELHSPLIKRALTTAGADSVYGPNFGISDTSLLKREARVRAMKRGEAEATEYARNNGYQSVRLLSVEEGTSYRGSVPFPVLRSAEANLGFGYIPLAPKWPKT